MGKGHRQGRLGEEIRKIISQMLLKEIKDPRLSPMVSITDVTVTKDGSYATCFVSFFTNAEGDDKEKQENEVIAGLESAKGLIKKEIGNEIRLRHVPELIFKMDKSLEYGRHMDEVIAGLNIKHDEDEE
ncbi:MAG: 30S ribosome-binding factor RbfA [Clostridiales bacterium]|nr:30S ribosome-binding factor RbfA [Clostridiales bacterium]MDD7347818.1 30S ribosome-binding factor RbfA [Clostridiales bacterium]MDY4060732.1 30S ribosome-binding factor RbfA [Anaerovoracaceae bacterium]